MKNIMKSILMTINVIALCFVTTPVFASDEAVDSTASIKDGTVTYTLAKDENPLTNGRIAVSFNENELTLVTAETAGLFELEDLNLKVETDEDGTKTIYFAFAATEAVTDEGVTLTLTFTADPSTKGKDVAITTTYEELDNADTAVERDMVDQDIIHVEKDPKPPVTPNNPNTGDNSHITWYIGLAFVALAGIAVALVGNKKKQKN